MDILFGPKNGPNLGFSNNITPPNILVAFLSSNNVKKDFVTRKKKQPDFMELSEK